MAASRLATTTGACLRLAATVWEYGALPTSPSANTSGNPPRDQSLQDHRGGPPKRKPGATPGLSACPATQNRHIKITMTQQDQLTHAIRGFGSELASSGRNLRPSSIYTRDRTPPQAAGAPASPGSLVTGPRVGAPPGSPCGSRRSAPTGALIRPSAPLMSPRCSAQMTCR